MTKRAISYLVLDIDSDFMLQNNIKLTSSQFVLQLGRTLVQEFGIHSFGKLRIKSRNKVGSRVISRTRDVEFPRANFFQFKSKLNTM